MAQPGEAKGKKKEGGASERSKKSPTLERFSAPLSQKGTLQAFYDQDTY